MVNVTVLDCSGTLWWMAFTNSIRILCGPGGNRATSIGAVLMCAHNHGRSSTCMCRCPTRGDALRASLPDSGPILTFSARHVIQTMPLARRSGTGGSTISLAGGASVGVGVSALAATAPDTIATANSNTASRFIKVSPFLMCVVQLLAHEHLSATYKLRRTKCRD